MSNKFTPGDRMPEFELPKVGGGTIRVGGEGKWQLAVVYRGKHCPLCKRYLTGVPDLKAELDELGVELIAMSADSEDQAVATMDEIGVDVSVGYGLDEARMKELGLYISEPRPNETDHRFPEPGLFVTNPKGEVQIVDISNAPFARPPLDGILRGIRHIQTKDYPIRGTAS
ncbi:MAG: peroxiredoxin-like family protein [Minwuia sp.]|uniref:peroxiredoxin-like family protein n=1 Tax=Minwuia sp. TaxID=2493630 RepID=UPI003A882609